MNGTTFIMPAKVNKRSVKGIQGIGQFNEMSPVIIPGSFSFISASDLIERVEVTLDKELLKRLN